MASYIASNVDELEEEVLGWVGPALVGWLRVAGDILCIIGVTTAVASPASLYMYVPQIRKPPLMVAAPPPRREPHLSSVSKIFGKRWTLCSLVGRGWDKLNSEARLAEAIGGLKEQL